VGSGAQSFAGKLKNVRENQGLSQYALARRAGLSGQALSLLELGQRAPTWETVQLLAAALGVDYAAFADPGIRLPEPEPAKPRGRPRKSAGVPVPRRALLRRVRRRLAAAGQTVRACPGAPGSPGVYVVVDRTTNAVVDTPVALEPLARYLEVLRPWEAVAED
jgi:transcriptional regulator with XRE-family HTH domain